MNLTNVKYGWLLFKFKDKGIEVEGNNILRVTESEMSQMVTKAQQFVHHAKVAIWKERDAELANIATREAEASEGEAEQLAFDLSA